MSEQHRIHELRVAFEQLPAGEEIRPEELRKSINQLHQLVQQVGAVARDAMERSDDGMTEDAASALEEAAAYLASARESSCNRGHTAEGMCVMCYNMAQSSLESALDDLGTDAREKAKGESV